MNLSEEELLLAALRHRDIETDRSSQAHSLFPDSLRTYQLIHGNFVRAVDGVNRCHVRSHGDMPSVSRMCPLSIFSSPPPSSSYSSPFLCLVVSRWSSAFTLVMLLAYLDCCSRTRPSLARVVLATTSLATM